MGIVITVLVGIVVLGAVGAIPIRLTIALLVSGGAVAVVGFIDDKWQVAAPVRLVVHVAAVSFYVFLLSRLPPIDFGIATVDLGIVGAALGGLALVWFLNLYNFMDGIDGLASVEAMSTAAAATAFLAALGIESPTLLAFPLLIAAVGGFLIWNWPPARIFMGDAGSGFLGFFLGGLAWFTVNAGQLSIWVWFILFGTFFVDATVTLLRRWWHGESLATAHRSHAYQRLSRRFRSHLPVTLGVLVVNVFWLTPLAWVATVHPSWGAVLLLIAWAPLVVLTWRWGAGLPGD